MSLLTLKRISLLSSQRAENALQANHIRSEAIRHRTLRFFLRRSYNIALPPLFS